MDLVAVVFYGLPARFPSHIFFKGGGVSGRTTLGDFLSMPSIVQLRDQRSLFVGWFFLNI